MFLPTIKEILENNDRRFKGVTRLWDVSYYIRSMGEYNLSPSYQREDVWTTEQQKKFIRSLMFRMPIPPVIMNILPDEREEKEGFRLNVIDGKQRLTALQMFVRDEFEVDGIIYSTLPKTGQWRLQNHSFSCIETRFETVEEEAEYYELFNYSGTAH